ncbi:MAG: sigma-70 family RNA polymerase sigma factor [Myxococcota bacterium]|nr:sigma-70 family RNA polymerase sigma factor [Myxococcota bacterium]
MTTKRSHDDADDRALLDQVIAQDSAAFRELFQRFYPRVFAFVQARLGDPSLAEETVADVFFEVWRSASGFRGASRVSTWIFGIATYKSLEADRNRRRLKRSAVVPTNLEVLHGFADDRDEAATLEARDELRWFNELLEDLPDGQREVLQLALVEGFDNQEIAERLGVAPGTVKSRLFRARSELREAMRRTNRMEA